MPEPQLIQRQRESLTALRRADRARRDAETAAHKQYEQTTTAADAAHKTACQNAETARTQALTAAESQRQTAQRAADAAAQNARSATQQQWDAIAAAIRNRRTALQKAGLEHLWPSAAPAAGPVDPAQAEAELTRRGQLAARAAVQIESALDDYRLLQERNARRHRLLMPAIVWGAILATVFVILGVTAGNSVICGAGILVPPAIFFFEWNREKRQDRRWEQAVHNARESRRTAAQLNARMPPRLRVLADQFDMTFVEVPAGAFTMGSPAGQGISNQHPQHTVYLDAFWIGYTPVTNAQYARCVAAGGCAEPRNKRWKQSVYADHPVTHVRRDKAVAYTRWLSQLSGLEIRLPTEAEWEKAARGTDGRLYPWGNQTPNERLLNFNDNVGDTTPVGGYPAGASPYGALDMAGNVWEWVGGWYGAGYYGQSSERNPTGPDTGDYRVLRGGAWDSDSPLVRCACRYGGGPGFRYVFRGYRLATGLSR